jgi:hypothetical protein
MSQEITIRSSLQVRKGNLSYLSQPVQIIADQNGVGGPVPGQLVVGVGGVDVSFAGLTQPGAIRIQNLDTNTSLPYSQPLNNLHWGVWDSDHSKFHPIGMCKPGESFVFRMSSQYLREYPSTGTGSGESSAKLHLRFEHQTGNALVECFQD